MYEPRRIELVEQLFHQALECDDERRAGFLAEACAGDVALLAAVASLLASYDRDQKFLQRPAFNVSAAELADNLFEDDCERMPEAPCVSGYRLVREVGRGGMGAVYEAVSGDGQRVAVKVVKRGMDNEFILGRFERERRILGALDHHYVARLLDGGATDNGIPFFVMEYVEGLPLDQYARAATLSTAERLALFLKVCEAVSNAHRHRVIHRDLKPSNILVTEAGEPKLLDFGVAKLLNLDSGGGTADATATAHRVMTPEYASPAQLRGLPPSETDDVYSLGVLLYILLTGHHPYRFRSRAPEEVLRSILEERVLRPSEALRHATASIGDMTDKAVSSVLPREIRGNLDKVVMKALRRESERRYASVEEIAEDIRRHLAGQPVSARGDSLAYRAARFSRTHPAYALSTAAVVLLCLLLALIFSLWRTHENPADVTADQIRPGKHYPKNEEAYRLYRMGRYFFNKRTKEDFHRGIEYFSQAIEKDPSYALAYAGMADCYGLLGAYFVMNIHVAFPSARSAANKALQLDEGLAEAHTSLALVHWLYDWDWAAADREFRTAIDLNPSYVTAHHWRGLFLGEMGRFDEAEEEMQKALKHDPISAAVYADYGRVLYWARLYDESLEKYRKASEMNADFGSMVLERELVYEQMGRLDDWKESKEKYGDFDAETREAYRTHGLKGYWSVVYRRELKQPTRGGNDGAEVFARVGDKDRALQALADAIDERDHRMSQLRVNPVFDSLRSDPRFAELLRRMNLTP